MKKKEKRQNIMQFRSMQFVNMLVIFKVDKEIELPVTAIKNKEHGEIDG